MTSNEGLPLLEGDEARAIDLDVTNQLGRVRVLEGVATRIADTLAYHLPTDGKSLLFVAGTGNNGANAIAAARMLHLRGRSVQVVPLVDLDLTRQLTTQAADLSKPLRPNIREQLDLFRYFCGDEKLFPMDLERVRNFQGVLIDGILGTGTTEPPRGVAANAILAMNTNSASTLSIDIPSGLNHITGEAPGSCVRATWTLNLHMLKKGLLENPAKEFVGELWSAESGLGFATFPEPLPEAFAKFYNKAPIRRVYSEP